MRQQLLLLLALKRIVSITIKMRKISLGQVWQYREALHSASTSIAP
jgi:hypothetical protein